MARTASTSSMVSSRSSKRWLLRVTGCMRRDSTGGLLPGQRMALGLVHLDLGAQFPRDGGVADGPGSEGGADTLGGDDGDVVPQSWGEVEDGSHGVGGSVDVAAVEADQRQIALGSGLVAEGPVGCAGVAEAACGR